MGALRLQAEAPKVSESPQQTLKTAYFATRINMVHISPWASTLGLIAGASRLLRPGAPLILYGPWLQVGVETAPGNLAFDADLRRRDPAWGLRRVEDFTAAAAPAFQLQTIRTMPANNLMLLFRRSAAGC